MIEFPIPSFAEKIKVSPEIKTAYPISAKQMWHNGVHFKTKNAIQAIYDGTIVAMRLNDTYMDIYSFDTVPALLFAINPFIASQQLLFQILTVLFDKSKTGYKLKANLSDSEKETAKLLLNDIVSNDFILIRHEVKTINDTPIVFYSLCQHITPLGRLKNKERITTIWYTLTTKPAKGVKYDCVSAYTSFTNNMLSGKVYIPCETQIKIKAANAGNVSSTNNIVSKIEYTLNGATKEVYIEKTLYRQINNKYEIKRQATAGEDGNTMLNASEYKYLQTGQVQSQAGIVVYSHENKSQRQAVYIVEEQETILFDNNNWMEQTVLDKGIPVRIQKGEFTGFVFLEAGSTAELAAVKNDYASFMQTTDKKKTIDIFAFEVVDERGIRFNTISVPKDAQVRTADIIAYGGYRAQEQTEITIQAEQTVIPDVHFEVFCPDNGFTTNDEKKEEPFFYKVNGSFSCYTQKPRAKIQTQAITIDAQTVTQLNNVYLQKTAEGTIFSGEVFYKMKVLAKLTVNTDYVLRSDFPSGQFPYNDVYKTYHFTADKTLQLYKEDGSQVVDSAGTGKTKSFLQGYHYIDRDKDKTPTVNGQVLQLRLIGYTYEAVPVILQAEFWVSQIVLENTAIKLNSNYYILETALAASNILAPPAAPDAPAHMVSTGSLLYTGESITQFSALNTPIVIKTWQKVTEENSRATYWIDESQISRIQEGTPIELCSYNKWNRFFKKCDNAKKENPIKDFSLLLGGATTKDGSQKLLDILTERIRKNAEERLEANRLKLGELINSEEEVRTYLSNCYYQRKTEWINDTDLLKTLKSFTVSFKDRVEKQRKAYVFWEEAKKLNSKGFPKSDTNWYFHPERFIDHLNKVIVSPEFNPYAGKVISVPARYEQKKNKNTGVERRVGSPGKIFLVEDNPGFAPVAASGVVTPYHHKGIYYAEITGAFNEDYLDVERGNGNTYREENNTQFKHEGIDFRGNSTTAIHSLINGIVLAYGWFETYGRTIILAHRETKGIYLLAHLSTYNESVLNKKYIYPSDIVGYVGGSGNGKDNTYAEHLHITYFDYQYTKGDVIANRSSENITTTSLYKNNILNKKYNPFIHSEKKL